MPSESTIGPDPRLNENDFPIWKETFCDATRREMVDEDLAAGHYVPYLLVGCASIGICLGLLAIVLTA